MSLFSWKYITTSTLKTNNVSTAITDENWGSLIDE